LLGLLNRNPFCDGFHVRLELPFGIGHNGDGRYSQLFRRALPAAGVEPTHCSSALVSGANSFQNSIFEAVVAKRMVKYDPDDAQWWVLCKWQDRRRS
jgi:hypothetical protein